MIQLLAKRRVKVAAAVIIFGTIYFFSFANRWSGYAYSTLSNGRDPVFVAYYNTDQACRDAVQKKIEDKIKMESGGEADAYACGRDCYLEGFTRSVSVTELQCSEVYFSRPIPK